MAKNRKNKDSLLRFPCVTFKQGDLELVSFIAQSSTLWKILEINRRDEDKDKGYQRVFSPSRLKSIAK